MKKQIQFGIVLTACTLLGAGCWYSEESYKRETSVETVHFVKRSLESLVSPDKGVEFIDANIFVIPELEAQSGRHLVREDAFTCTRFRAGIVNHHALASDVIAGFFRTLKRCRPDIERMIILSPDHALGANASVVTHRLDYRFFGEDMPVDQASVNRLLASVPFAREQPMLFEREHGIGALLPFVSSQFPEVRVVPLILRGSTSINERNRLSSWMEDELLDPHVFVVISSDMSHYLNEVEAKENDQKTKEALSEGNIDFFEKADDDFTDSGTSIAVVLQATGRTNWHLLGEAISSDYAGSPAFTTTYLVGFLE